MCQGASQLVDWSNGRLVNWEIRELENLPAEAASCQLDIPVSPDVPGVYPERAEGLVSLFFYILNCGRKYQASRNAVTPTRMKARPIQKDSTLRYR
jgi:hypothetical protein